MSTVPTNYYAILEVSEKASDQEIRVAYKKKALQYHPDKAVQNQLTVEKATAVFKQINEAYEVLSDSQKRRSYDLKRGVKPSTNFRSSFFDEDFSFPMRNAHFSHTHASTYEREEASFIPDKIDQETSDTIDSDNSDLLNEFLKNKNSSNSLLKSILYYSCKKGKFNIVKNFLEIKKLSARLKINDGLSFTGPIFKAAAESGHLDLVKYLVEVHRVDIESQGLTAGTQDTALSRAASQGHELVVEYLISKGANLNPEVSYSDILNQAIGSKKLSIVRRLVEAGTKIGDFHLGEALKKGVVDIVQYFLQKRPGIKSHLYGFSSPACLAVKSGHVNLVKYLEEKESLNLFEGKDNLHSILIAAAESGSIEMMKFLLDEKGLNEKVLTNEKYRQSILREAVKHKSVLTTESEKQDTIKFARFLMEERRFLLPKETLAKLICDSAEFSGIEMNCYLQSYVCESNQTKDLLLVIAHQGLEACNLADLFKLHNSRKMIKKGQYGDFSLEVHLHIKERRLSLEQLRAFCLENKQAMTEALFYYSSYYFKNDLSPLKLLLELGVDLNAENSEGIAAIHVALHSGGYNNIVQFYVDNKADLSKKNKNGQTAADVLKRLPIF